MKVIVLIVVIITIGSIGYADEISNNYNEGLKAMEVDNIITAKNYFTKVYELTEYVAQRYKSIYPDEEKTIYNAMARYKLGIIHIRLSKKGTDKKNYISGMKHLDISCKRGYQPACDVINRIKGVEYGKLLDYLRKSKLKESSASN